MVKPKRLWIIIVGMLLAATWTGVLATAGEQWPVPQGWVTDSAGLFSEPEKGDMERIITRLEKVQGVEIAVVAVETTGSYSPKEYAVELFSRWGVGKKGQDNGLLILVADKERRVEVETGYGLEGTLTDAKIGSLLDRTFLPEARAGRIGQGVLALLVHMEQTLNSAGDLSPTPHLERPADVGPMIAVILLALVLIIGGGAIGAFSLARGSRARCPKCGQKLQIQRTVLKEPTQSEDGTERFTYKCTACSYSRTTQMVLPALVAQEAARQHRPPWFGPGGFGGRGGGGTGGFGGFGGGRSGGGGAGRSW